MYIRESIRTNLITIKLIYINFDTLTAYCLRPTKV